jgi:predicted dehydrogenase
MGSEHEDLVHITGQLAGGQTFSCSVNWISPRKVRRTQVIGKKGMFVADTLNTSLTFTEFNGGKEGEPQPVALEDREPLAIEIEGFAALISRGDDSAVVTLEEGLDNVALAEAALQSAATGASIQLQALQS